MNMIQFLIHHFLQMLPLIILAGLAVAVIAERTMALYWVYPLRNSSKFFDSVRSAIMADRTGEAIAQCERYGYKPVAYVVKQGLIRAHHPKEVIEDGLAIATGEAIDRVRARTGYLSMIANVSTLLGLIGTIFGLVRSFEAVGGANAQERSALLAQGISMSMNHTLWGLCIAVPCMIAFSFLTNRSNRIKAELERAAVRTIDIVKQRYIATADIPGQRRKNRESSDEYRRAQ